MAEVSKSSNSVSHREHIFRTILVVDDDPFRAFARCAALEAVFYRVTRAANAAETFIRLADPLFAANLALVVASLNLPGLAGPEFVRELTIRMPQMPVLAVASAGETPQDYPGTQVHFLPQQTSPEDILAAALESLAHPRARVA